MAETEEMDAGAVAESAREALVLLARSADSGESLTILEVQEGLGLGYSDARAVMGLLVERGMASEDAPGEWSPAEERPGSMGDPSGPEGRVEVEVGEEGPLERDDGAAAAALQTLLPEPTVRLPRAAVEAMDDAALGQLVKASLPPEGQWFLMEIS